MTGKEIVQALRCCAKGLGHDDACENCKVGEIQDRREYIEFAAANVIERLTDENAALRKEIEWKDMVIALAQRKQVEAEAERDALREKQLWIPVTERMPELEVPVLVLDRRGNMLVRTLRRLVSDKEAVFRPDGLAPRKNITHWLPLPEAPEEGGKA